MKPVKRTIDIVLDYSGKFVQNILSNVPLATEFEGKSVEKIIGITHLYGKPAFIIKWKESGLFEPVLVMDALMHYESDAHAYYTSTGQPIPTPHPIPSCSTNGSHHTESTSSGSNSDSGIQTSNGYGSSDPDNTANGTSDTADSSPENNGDGTTDLNDGECQNEDCDSDSSEDLDILDLTCEDTIDYETIMSWPSAFDSEL